MIRTKTGDRVVLVEITNDCYSQDRLVQVQATLEDSLVKRLIYISDLREDKSNEIRDVVRAALKDSQTQ